VVIQEGMSSTITAVACLPLLGILTTTNAVGRDAHCIRRHGGRFLRCFQKMAERIDNATYMRHIVIVSTERPSISKSLSSWEKSCSDCLKRSDNDVIVARWKGEGRPLRKANEEVVGSPD
jgi:hypothetical protein